MRYYGFLYSTRILTMKHIFFFSDFHWKLPVQKLSTHDNKNFFFENWKKT